MHTVHGKNFYGIPQGSILGPLIFNIFLCDLFYFLEGVSVASYADDTTPYSSKKMFKVKNSIAPEIMKELFAPIIT